MSVLLDTNILIFLSKSSNSELLGKIVNPENEKIFISIASLGELKSIAVQNNWGSRKWTAIEDFLKDCILLEINESLLETYAQIDSYSQCRNPSFTNKEIFTPRNMGKNDLWIAAAAALLNLTLITTDKDFTHLHGVFINVKLLKPEMFLH